MAPCRRGPLLPPFCARYAVDVMQGLPDLPPELCAMIARFLGARTFDGIRDIANWSGTRLGICDDKVFCFVVTECLGVVPRVAIQPEQPSLLWPQAPDGGQFWRKVVSECMKELVTLPRLMQDAFLKSNERQRARWRGVFVRRELPWLGARMLLGDDPDPPPRHSLYEDEFRDIEYPRPDNGEEDEDEDEDDYPVSDQMREDLEAFLQGSDTTEAFKAMLREWIEDGWEFDEWLGMGFEHACDPDADDYYTLDGDYAEGFADHRSKHQNNKAAADAHLLCFGDQMQMFLESGADPTISGKQLLSTLNPHRGLPARYRAWGVGLLVAKLRFLLDNKVRVQFDSKYAWTVKHPCMALIHCYFSSNQYLSIHAKKPADNAIVELFVHLASDCGSDASRSIRAHLKPLLLEAFSDESCVKYLYEALQEAPGGFSEWEPTWNGAVKAYLRRVQNKSW